jgi:hypothetical protein
MRKEDAFLYVEGIEYFLYKLSFIYVLLHINTTTILSSPNFIVEDFVRAQLLLPKISVGVQMYCLLYFIRRYPLRGHDALLSTVNRTNFDLYFIRRYPLRGHDIKHCQPNNL